MKYTQTKIILFVSLFFTLFDNYLFFEKTYAVFHNIYFVISTGIILISVLVFLFNIILNRYTLKPILVILFIISSVATYFMQMYGTVIDDKMIQNIIETDIREVHDLLNLKLFIYIVILGVIPSIVLYKIEIIYKPLKEELVDRIKYIIGSLIVIIISLFSFSKVYASFFREHKSLRYYTNPTFYLYNLGKYINETYLKKPIPFKHIGMDAKIEETKKPKLIIFVLGEAARYDHFSLNGYKRNTNPMLEKISSLIDFPNVHSCGTETAVSVPCMFSPYDRSNYSDKKAKNTDSVIDVLNYAGVNILWRDNDGGSKKVASRIKNYEDFNHDQNKKYCDKSGCYDEILFVGLQKWIYDINNSKPIFIVLHTKGSHGPAYYKRYPKKYEKFKPVCKTNQLQECKKEEVINAYDNTILYTDYILDKTIKLLKENEKKYQVAMYYIADHGESLGENGIYLHGLPYFIAPDVQKHPASVSWFGKDFEINQTCVKKERFKHYTHDNIFSTILGLVGIKTKEYKPEKDIFRKCYIKKE